MNIYITNSGVALNLDMFVSIKKDKGQYMVTMSNSDRLYINECDYHEIILLLETIKN